MNIRKIRSILNRISKPGVNEKKKAQRIKDIKALLEEKHDSIIKIDSNPALDTIKQFDGHNDTIIASLISWLDNVEESMPKRMDDFINSLGLEPYMSPVGKNDEVDEIVMRLLHNKKYSWFGEKAKNSRGVKYRNYCIDHPLRVAMFRKVIIER